MRLSSLDTECQKSNKSAYDYKSHPCLNLLENKPQINADERRFVVPAICSSLLSIDANQQNNHFFAPFAFFAVKNSANQSKTTLELPPNIFDAILKVKRE
jgi:hypothetical protein